MGDGVRVLVAVALPSVRVGEGVREPVGDGVLVAVMSVDVGLGDDVGDGLDVAGVGETSVSVGVSDGDADGEADCATVVCMTDVAVITAA